MRIARPLLALALTCWALLCGAHPMPESTVWIDTTPDGLVLTAQVPLNRLEFAFGRPLSDQPETAATRYGDALPAYLLRHVGARSGGDQGPGWQVLRPRLSVLGHGASAELEARFELHAPPGADARSPQLLYDVVNHEVVTHRVQVFLRNDWTGGRAGQAPLLLGELRHGTAALALRLADGHAGGAFASLFHDGLVHIAHGTDHLLFLLALLVAAPLAARGRRWGAARPWRAALAHTGRVVTAFTLGHTVTLALGSVGWLDVPPQAVEVAVALTILCAALHAWRPLFARAETGMALAFGLVHGLAFSSSLSGAGLTPWQHAQALFAFNVGIEAMQLAVLAIALPPLLLLAATRADLYARLRPGFALLAGALSCAWVADRLAIVDLSDIAWLGDSAVLPASLVGALWMFSLLSQIHRKKRHSFPTV